MVIFDADILKNIHNMNLKIFFSLLLSHQAASLHQSKVFSGHCDSKRVVKQNEDIELTFNVGKGGGFISNGNTKSRVLVFGLKNMINLSNLSNMNIINRTENEVTLKISNINMQNAGKFYIKQFEKYESEYCGVNLIVTRTPTVSIHVSDEEDGVTFACDTSSTSRPRNHNLTMVYRWFVGDSFQQAVSKDLHLATSGQIQIDTTKLICVASDNPDCVYRLLSISLDTKLDDLREDKECADVLGIFEKFNSKLTLLHTISQNAVIGKTAEIIWILSAFPEIEINHGSLQTPTGIGTNFINVTLKSTSTPLQYKLTLTVPVITQYDIGRYCVSVYNHKRMLTVCHTLFRDLSLIIGTSASGAFLLLVILAVVFVVFIRRMKKRDQPVNQADDISLHDQSETYETVPDREDENVNNSDEVRAGHQTSSGQSSPPTHTTFTPSLSTIYSTNKPDDTSSSTSSDSSHHTNKKKSTSTCTNLSIVVNYSSGTSKSSLSTNSSDTTESEVTPDYLNSYDQLNPQSQVSLTENYQKLKL